MKAYIEQLLKELQAEHAKTEQHGNDIGSMSQPGEHINVPLVMGVTDFAANSVRYEVIKSLEAILDADEEFVDEFGDPRRRLLVTKRAEDFHVHVESADGGHNVWGYGPTIDAAVGDLIRHYMDDFHLHLWYGTNFDERPWTDDDKALRSR